MGIIFESTKHYLKKNTYFAKKSKPMTDDFQRFDMARPPVRTRWFLRPITYLLSFPDCLAHNTQIHYEGT